MRHMGKNGKFAVICGIVAAGLLVLTGMTLAEPVFVAFLGVLALAYLAAVAELLIRRRRLALLAVGAGTSLTIACTLAFLSTWELAYDGKSSFIGTPLPTNDPDNYFMVAAATAVGTLAVLFLGTVWPSRRRPIPARRQSPVRGPATPGRSSGRGRTSSAGQRPAAQRTGTQRTAAQRTATQRTAGQRSGTPGSAAQRPAAQRSASGNPAQRTSGTRAPAKLPAAPARRPAPKPGNGSVPRR